MTFKEEVADIDELTEEDDEIVKFDTVEEAEDLVVKYKEQKKKKGKDAVGPCPALIVEVGDLVLHTDWGSSHGGDVSTAILLRKKKD